MSRISRGTSNVLIYEFHQETGDEDYGSCLWARFYLDLDRYNLLINSDCGNFAYGWSPTESETFTHLLSRCREDYLLEKLSCRSEIDGNRTMEAVKDYLIDTYGEDCVNGACLDNIIAACYSSSSDEILVEALLDAAGEAGLEIEDSVDAYEMIYHDYPADAKKIVDIFLNFVVPELLKEGE